jgi:tRNA A-37 threonylcarbamoyl transferase component Bud32
MRTPVTNSLFSNLIRALDEAEVDARQRGAGQLVAGDRLGEYVLREHVATGGFGAVWRAEHQSSGQEVAVKVLHSYLVSSEDAVSRFEREIRVIACMRHPNIVELLDCGRLEDGRPYLVTEFLRGIDLDTRIEQQGALPPELALSILEQLCAALSAAHAQKIVHRDVKASNVLLSERDGQMRVVLVDFGVAKLIDDSNPGLTVSNVLVGSLACLSPEQIRNRPVDARTDVYALGSLAYHMLTGEPPFAYAGVTEIINLHLDRDPPVPSSICALPAALDGVIMTALRKAPEQRFADPQVFIDAFRRALAGAGAGAVPGATAVRSMRALGIFVETEAEHGDLAHPDEALLDDVEDILVRAEYCLDAEGFGIARERSNALLFVRSMTCTESGVPALRRHAVTVAKHLYHRLARRPGRDPRVRIRICVHEANVLVSGDELQGGPLLSLAEWLPAEWSEGVFASQAVLTNNIGTGEPPATRPPSWPAGGGHGQRGSRCLRSAHGSDGAGTSRARDALAFSDTLPAFSAGMKPACLA